MRLSYFYRLGESIYRFRKAIIVAWLIIIVGCIPFIPNVTKPFQSTGFVAVDSESDLTNQYLDKKIGYNSNRFVIIYHSDRYLATDPAYNQKLKQSLKNLKRFPIKHKIFYPTLDNKQIAKDKHTSFVVILLQGEKPITPEELSNLKSLIHTPKGMKMTLGGEGIFIESVNKQTQRDLYRSDFIATPVSILALLLVFGTLVAAIVPILLGGGCALIILTMLYGLGHMMSLSVFTLNIALLLGLCLTLDYALFIISRFRDELHKNNNLQEAIATTLATAGKAVFFSGLAVFISLSALLLFPINILFSVGIGGLAAVSTAVMLGITLLPAILSVLSHNINKLSLYPHTTTMKKNLAFRFWHHLGVIVVKQPIRYFLITLMILFTLGYPFYNARFGISDFHILPKHAESRAFFNIYQDKFNVNELSPILLVVTSPQPILSKKSLSEISELTQKIKDNPYVKYVDGIVSTRSNIKPSEYYSLYHMSDEMMPSNVKNLITTTTRQHVAVLTIVSKYDANSPKTKDLIHDLRHLQPNGDLSIQLTGVPVSNIDVFDSIQTLFPYAITWIMVLTYIILLILLRSVFLPFKAIIMNILSLCASYGVLVFIFQEGHFQQLLNFNAQGMLDISLLVIIFCALFGFSMDYEVFLLTRIYECYQTTHHTRKSVVFGIVKSSRIITSAAIIVICICGSFMVADDIMVKEFGLGIAIAIFVDAFIIRTLLVPATMVLVKQWNWYLPNWLNRLLPNSAITRTIKIDTPVLKKPKTKME